MPEIYECLRSLEVVGSNPAPATSRRQDPPWLLPAFFLARHPATVTPALPSVANAGCFFARPPAVGLF
jgi:hypothetical protein